MSQNHNGNVQVATIDRDAVLDRVGGDLSLLREIADIFLHEYPELLQQCEQAVARGDAHLLERSAHTLKGAVSNFCADPVTEAAYRLEMIGRKQMLNEAPTALLALQSQLDQLQPALEHLSK